jgi:hypothetical protein
VHLLLRAYIFNFLVATYSMSCPTLGDVSTKSRKKFLNESEKAKEQDKTLRVFVNERGIGEILTSK